MYRDTADGLLDAAVLEDVGAMLLWKEDGFHLLNPGGFRIPIEEAYVGGNSDPRNGKMMKMFSLVNVGERVGGSIPDMVSKWERTGYERPVLSERVNPERSTIFLPLRRWKSGARPFRFWRKCNRSPIQRIAGKRAGSHGNRVQGRAHNYAHGGRWDRHQQKIRRRAAQATTRCLSD